MNGPPGYPVRSSRRLYEGPVITVRRDDVMLPAGTVVGRDVVEHPGAVGAVALDADGRVALIEQYRHPVGQRLWELPAGLLDVPGETAHAAVARELREEAGLAAGRWDVLVDTLTSPGMTDEAIRVYLARDLRDVPRPPGADEEADIRLAWVPLDEAVARVLAGDIRNGMACVGLLAAGHAQREDFAHLRAADASWPDRQPTHSPVPAATAT